MVSTSHFCPHCGAAYTIGEKQCSFCQHVFADELDPFDQNTLFHERYQILNQIGTGGFGAVYQARDMLEQQRLVAIKQINLRGLTAQEIIEATDGFNRERQFLSSLTHDHLPRIYDHFMDAEHWYLIMEFIKGESLEAYLESITSASASFVHALSVDEIVDIGLQLCDVLTYLHGQCQPIIFRDLKPSNVMRTDRGAIYLIDFGIARYFKPGKLKDTIPFGSPGYAAPEQYGKGQTTAQADIYSLGAMLYYMLSGLDPAENPFHFAPLRLYGAAGLAELEALIMQMVALDVQQRPRSVDVVIIELEYIRRLRGGSAQRIRRPPTSQPFSSAAQAAGSMPYWQGSAGQSGQSQMQQPQAQSSGTGAPGIARRTLMKRGWQITLAIGVGSVFLYNAIPAFHSSPVTNTGPELNNPVLDLVFETTMPNGAANITKVLCAPLYELFAVADEAGNVFVLSTSTYQVIYQLHVQQPVTSLSWTFDAQYLSIAAGRSIYIWEIPPVEDDTKEGKLAKDPWAAYHNVLPAVVQTVSWNPVDKMTLAVGDIDGNVQVFQISSKGVRSRPLYELAASPWRSLSPDIPQAAAVNWIGGWLYAMFDRDSVKVWDLNNPQSKAGTIKFAGLNERVQEVLWLPMTDATNLVAAVLTADGQVNFIDKNYQVVQNLLELDAVINELVYSPDGQYMFGVVRDGIYAWAIQSPMSEASFFFHQATLLTIDYVENSDGRLVITSGTNGAIQIWKVE